MVVAVRRIMLVRLAQEGKEGKFVAEQMVSHMWEDVDKKSKKLEVLMSSCCAILLMYFIYNAGVLFRTHHDLFSHFDT